MAELSITLRIVAGLADGAAIEKIKAQAEELGLVPEVNLGQANETPVANLAAIIEGVIKSQMGGVMAKLGGLTADLEAALELIGVEAAPEAPSIDLELESKESDSEPDSEPAPQQREIPEVTGQTATTYPVLRADPETGTARAISVDDWVWLSIPGLAECLGLDNSGVARWAKQSGLGKKFRPENGKRMVFVDPHAIIPWAAGQGNKRAEVLKCLTGRVSIKEAVDGYVANGAVYRCTDDVDERRKAVAAKKAATKAKKVKRLTNNSSAREVVATAKALGCTVTHAARRHTISHPKLKKELSVGDSATHTPPNVFNALNRLIS